jgi:hypothetical protein
MFYLRNLQEQFKKAFCFKNCTVNLGIRNFLVIPKLFTDARLFTPLFIKWNGKLVLENGLLLPGGHYLAIPYFMFE